MPLFNHFKHRSLKYKQAGFTLIEVMVSLLILSMVVTSLSYAVSQSTNNISQLKERQFAAWVAHNQISLYLLDPQNRLTGRTQFAGFNYHWKISKSATDVSNFNKIAIEVASEATPEYILANIVAYQGGK
jgi:general secretion pathway protein I